MSELRFSILALVVITWLIAKAWITKPKRKLAKGRKERI